ncbi:MAG: hypothetical protein IMW85_05930, partial [Thermicanus sp.]|nr:hypothetical protein [Thermicanus sp.]
MIANALKRAVINPARENQLFEAVFLLSSSTRFSPKSGALSSPAPHPIVTVNPLNLPLF